MAAFVSDPVLVLPHGVIDDAEVWFRDVFKVAAFGDYKRTIVWGGLVYRGSWPIALTGRGVMLHYETAVPLGGGKGLLE